MPRKPKATIPDDCMPMCQSCKFWVYHKEVDGGFCHRMPPTTIVIGDDLVTCYPSTDENDWCGLFERKTS